MFSFAKSRGNIACLVAEDTSNAHYNEVEGNEDTSPDLPPFASAVPYGFQWFTINIGLDNVAIPKDRIQNRPHGE